MIFFRQFITVRKVFHYHYAERKRKDISLLGNIEYKRLQFCELQNSLFSFFCQLSYEY